MDEHILKELIKVNKYLEQIDWKLWSFYDAFFNKGMINQLKPAQESNTKPEPVTETSQVEKPMATNSAKVSAPESTAPAKKPIINVPKYPSIEEL